MQYSWFCRQYRAWAAKVDVVMRQEHRAGEKLFVDYAGHTVGVVNRDTGELREAQIFVAVLGASSYTYAEATWTQALPDWIASHVRAFEFVDGSTELLIPDNLRSAVSRAHRYEPDTNPTYHDLACHYAVAVLPARVKKPREPGWPRVVAHPRLPQIRACPIRAPGSSDDGLAAQRYTLCTTRAAGRG